MAELDRRRTVRSYFDIAPTGPLRVGRIGAPTAGLIFVSRSDDGKPDGVTVAIDGTTTVRAAARTLTHARPVAVPFVAGRPADAGRCPAGPPRCPRLRHDRAGRGEAARRRPQDLRGPRLRSGRGCLPDQRSWLTGRAASERPSHRIRVDGGRPGARFRTDASPGSHSWAAMARFPGRTGPAAG